MTNNLLHDNLQGTKVTHIQRYYIQKTQTHPYAGGFVEQQYLPDKLKDRIYYTPTDYGFERQVKE